MESERRDDQKPKSNLDEYKKLMESWTEYLNFMSGKGGTVPSIGPLQTSREQMAAVNRELTDATRVLTTYNNHLAQYYQKVGSAWAEASKKAIAKCQESNVGDNLDKIQKIWIATLEEEFTELFSREDFAEVSGELLKSESEVIRRFSNIAEIYSRNLKLPTRSEVNDIYGELAKMKRTLKHLSDRIDRMEDSGGSGHDV